MTTQKNTIKPLGNRVLIKRSEARTTKGGIILPNTAQEKPREGEIISAGPGKPNDDGTVQSMSVQTGDRVLFSSYAGTEIKIDDEDFLIMSENDILGVLIN